MQLFPKNPARFSDDVSIGTVAQTISRVYLLAVPFEQHNEINAEEAAALFDASPVLPVPSADAPTGQPATPRMRAAARRRQRNQSADDQRPVAERLAEVMDEPLPRPQFDPVAAASAALSSPTSVASFVELQRHAMRAAFTERGVTIASLQLEMLAVARTAAAEGEYRAAGALYKTIAQTLGAINVDKHLHLHQTAGALAAAANGQLPDFRASTDQELYALIERSKQQQTILEQAPAPLVETSPAPAATDAQP